MIINVTSAVDGDFYSIEKSVVLDNSLLGSREGQFTKPATIKGWYTVVDEKVAVYFDLSTSASFECDSCSSLATVDFDLKISETFLTKPPVVEDGTDDEIDEDYHIYNGEEIDLMPIVNERVVLAVPSKVLCKDDCKGMCNKCGQNFNEGTCKCEDITNRKDNESNDGDNPFSVLKNYKY